MSLQDLNSLNPPPGSPPELELYKSYRDYITHEDALINNRLSWNFAIQGFLFAAFSFSAQKIAEVNAKLLSELRVPRAEVGDLLVISGVGQLHLLLIVLALVGLFVSALVYVSVGAARVAIASIEDKWLSLNPNYGIRSDKTNTHGPLLPGIIGGGAPEAHGWGFKAPIALPIVFVVAWGTLLFYAIRN